MASIIVLVARFVEGPLGVAGSEHSGGGPNKLVFFEVFSSEDAHKFHLEQAYTKKLFAGLDGKLASASRRDPTESAVFLGKIRLWAPTSRASGQPRTGPRSSKASTPPAAG
jgi:hypothetical protein